MNTATDKDPKETRPMREAPKDDHLCLFKSGKWFCWQIDGIPHLYRKNRFKHKDLGYFVVDYESLGAVDGMTMPDGMDAMEWGVLLGVVKFWREGIQ